jgi:hypothetical protein
VVRAEGGDAAAVRPRRERGQPGIDFMKPFRPKTFRNKILIPKLKEKCNHKTAGNDLSGHLVLKAFDLIVGTCLLTCKRNF